VYLDGVIYGVAGIADFSKVIAFALDATTGKPIWVNRECGLISEVKQDGGSLQSELFMSGGALCFRSPGHYGVVRIDPKTGRVLNEVIDDFLPKRTGFRTFFSAYYPRYGSNQSFVCKVNETSSLVVDMGGDQHGKHRYSNRLTLSLYTKGLENIAPGALSMQKLIKEQKLKPTWSYKSQGVIRGFIAGDSEVIVASVITSKNGNKKSLLEGVDLVDGKTLWSQVLQGEPVKYGISVNSSGKIFISTTTGKIETFTK
jgi:outer membrane protein assembly factor BamB